MHKRILRTLPVFIALALGSGWASAQATDSSTNSSSTTSGTGYGQAGMSSSQGGATKSTSQSGKDQKLSQTDRKFIEDAAKGGMFEVQSGQLAAQKASDPQVKEFANRLVQDHTKANDELMQIAQSKGIQMPGKDKSGDKHEMDKLQKLSGQDFDREFALHGIKDHEKDIKKFQEATSTVKDPDVRAWAEKQLPILREHLAMAQKLPGAGSQKSTTSSNSSSNSTAGGNSAKN